MYTTTMPNITSEEIINITEVIDVEGCPNTVKVLHPSHLGVSLAVPEWEAILTAIVLSIIIMLTIIGNVLVILSVFTYKPLRIVQNFFIVSLAVADLTVAVLVLPFNVAYSILGRWEFGIHLCKMWLTCDVMCCTSSILNLCAIALDRYWAITDPINYAQKRTVGRVLLLIAGVWILSLIISSPPLIGWNDWPDEWSSEFPCQLTSNQGYVIYSSLGSFYIPLIIMTIVYIEIFVATKRRLRERAKASRINAITIKSTTTQHDQDSVSSETNHNEHPSSSDSKCGSVIVIGSGGGGGGGGGGYGLGGNGGGGGGIVSAIIKTTNTVEKHPKKKSRRPKAKDSVRQLKQNNERLLQAVTREESVTDNNQDNSSESKKPNGNSGGFSNTTGEKNNFKTIEKSSSRVSLKKAGGVYQFIEEKQKISLSKERRAARTLGIIMGVFVVCWLPFFLMYVILPFCPTCCPTDKLINFITWLGYINSALNPVIYTIFNLDYRRAFKKLLGINR